MPMEYSNPERRKDEWGSLPDIEVFELTGPEVAGMDDELVHEYGKRPEFRLHNMNSTVRDEMLTTISREENISGGWCWHSCMPGCLPDGHAMGPFNTYAEALEDAQDIDPDETHDDFCDKSVKLPYDKFWINSFDGRTQIM